MIYFTEKPGNNKQPTQPVVNSIPDINLIQKPEENVIISKPAPVQESVLQSETHSLHKKRLATNTFQKSYVPRKAKKEITTEAVNQKHCSLVLTKTKNNVFVTIHNGGRTIYKGSRGLLTGPKYKKKQLSLLEKILVSRSFIFTKSNNFKVDLIIRGYTSRMYVKNIDVTKVASLVHNVRVRYNGCRAKKRRRV